MLSIESLLRYVLLRNDERYSISSCDRSSLTIEAFFLVLTIVGSSNNGNGENDFFLAGVDFSDVRVAIFSACEGASFA